MNKNKIKIFLIILSVLILMSCKENNEVINKNAPFYSNQIDFKHPRFSKKYDSTKILDYYPLIAYNDGSYMIAAEIDTKKIFDEFDPIFLAHGYSGSGLCWEDHIKLILTNEKPELLKYIFFDSETGGFYMYANSKSKQLIIAKYLSEIFSDKNKLNNYLKNADRSKIYS